MTDIAATIASIYSLWNEGDSAGVMNAFETLGPNGFTIEYVGSAPIDGRTAVEDMLAKYSAICKVYIGEVLVNDDEAAVAVENRLATDDGPVSMPSIETYQIKDGKLAVRYYHRSAH